MPDFGIFDKIVSVFKVVDKLFGRNVFFKPASLNSNLNTRISASISTSINSTTNSTINSQMNTGFNSGSNHNFVSAQSTNLNSHLGHLIIISRLYRTIANWWQYIRSRFRD